RQTKNRQEETKHRNRANQQAQTFGRVDKNEHGREVDQQGGNLDQYEARGVRVKRQTIDERNRVRAHVRRTPQRQQLKQAEQQHPKQRQLQNVSADAKRAELPTIDQPQDRDGGSAQEKDRERPIVDRPVSERR